MNEVPNLHQLLSLNRAEELGYDVWNEFVLPPFFESLSVGYSRKPRVVIGGRGCGKTMLLRYLSHDSTFSVHREYIPPEALNQIGVYWRVDTQFASLLQRRGIDDDVWLNAFGHLAAIVVGLQVTRSLQSIAKSALGSISSNHLESLSFKRLRPYSAQIPDRFSAFQDFLEDEILRFQSWVSNLGDHPRPTFLPGMEFVRQIIFNVCKQIESIKEAGFFVYIDEYENLLNYQQRIINTWLKHSEPPLIINFAMKRNGFKTRQTIGEETLSNIHDYRDIDLETFGAPKSFAVYAAEILILRLKIAGSNADVINADSLRKIGDLGARRSEAYTERVLNYVTNFLPTKSLQTLANEAMQDSALRQRLHERIAKGVITRRNLRSNVDEFFLDDFPGATIIMPALLHRDTLSLQELRHQIALLQTGKSNKFDGATGWIHNNLFGSYLQLFEGLSRACPIYGGFRTYCYMARGNLRHFLELSSQALAGSQGSAEVADISPIAVQRQAEVARQVSAHLLSEIRSFGSRANDLHAFVLRIGSLFSLSQQRPSQSEPERTHFSIRGSENELNERERNLLREAVTWSVLFEDKGTKKKSDIEPDVIEYVINPIYAPYFRISYRKKRKLELAATDASILLGGSFDKVVEMFGRFKSQWSVELTNPALPLFALIDEEGRTRE